jgi:hypothetical protein
MEPVLTRCGYRCDLCLAYRPNVEAHPKNRQILSDGWHTYFGFRIPADQICCDGCMSEDPKLIDTACPVRPCVLERGLASCAKCAELVCAKLEERLVTYEEVRSRTGRTIPSRDYERFIRPYENARRLAQLRGSDQA